jgi:hypothetical protein
MDSKFPLLWIEGMAKLTGVNILMNSRIQIHTIAALNTNKAQKNLSL